MTASGLAVCQFQTDRRKPEAIQGGNVDRIRLKRRRTILP